MLIDRLVSLEQVAEAESTEGSKGDAEEEEIGEIQKHLLHHFEPTFPKKYVSSPPISSILSFETVP